MGDEEALSRRARPQSQTRASDDEWLSEAEAARLLRISPRTLRWWRSKGMAPPWARVGKQVLYRRSAVLKWLEDKEKGGP